MTSSSAYLQVFCELTFLWGSNQGRTCVLQWEKIVYSFIFRMIAISRKTALDNKKLESINRNDLKVLAPMAPSIKFRYLSAT